MCSDIYRYTYIHTYIFIFIIIYFNSCERQQIENLIDHVYIVTHQTVLLRTVTLVDQFDHHLREKLPLSY